MITFLLIACAAKHESEPVAMSKPQPAPVAHTEPAAPVEPTKEEKQVDTNPNGGSGVATLSPREGGRVSGAVAFTQSEKEVKVSINLLNANPGEYVIHLHDSGSCTMAGAPKADEMDDIGKVTVEANGEGHADLTLDNKYKLAQGDEGILGRAVIIGDGDACGVVAAR
jgi:Cu/Zn superoxide dismutase